MRILFLNPYLPLPRTSGDNVRSFLLMSYVSKIHDVVALVYSNKYESNLLSEVKQFCESYYQIQQKKAFHGYFRLNKNKIPQPFRAFLQRRMKRTFSHLLKHNVFDLIHCGHPALMSLIPQKCKIPIVLQQDSLHTLTILAQIGAAGFLRKKHANQREAEIRDYLKSVWRRADSVLVPTEANHEELQQLEPGAHVEVVPHGVDADYYLRSRFLKSSKTITLTGAMDRPVNTNAALFFLHEIWPKLREREDDVRLFIVGRRPTPEVVRFNRLRNVHVTGEVIDIRPFLGSASVAVFPQQEEDSAGVKILEAMSMSIPVVCSPQACRGLGLVNKKQVIVSDTIKDFIDNILQCINDQNLSVAIGREARAFVEKHHSWEVVAHKLLAVYDGQVSQYAGDRDETTFLPVTRVDFPELQEELRDKDEIFEPSAFEDDGIRP